MSDKSFQELRSRSLFARLKRLFSNDVIVRNVGGKKLKVIDTDEDIYDPKGKAKHARPFKPAILIE